MLQKFLVAEICPKVRIQSQNILYSLRYASTEWCHNTSQNTLLYIKIVMQYKIKIYLPLS